MYLFDIWQQSCIFLHMFVFLRQIFRRKWIQTIEACVWITEFSVNSAIAASVWQQLREIITEISTVRAVCCNPHDANKMLDAAMLFLRVKLILLPVGGKKQRVTRIYGDEKYLWFCRYYSFELCHRKKKNHTAYKFDKFATYLILQGTSITR